MAGNLTDFLENKLLEHATGKAAYTVPSATYVALFTGAPVESGGGTEVSGGSYAREAVTWGNAAAGIISNSGTITFTTASANWGTVTHLAIFDAVSTGNMLFYGPLTASRVVNNGDVFQFTAGQISIALD